MPQITAHPVLDPGHRGLAHEVAGKEQTGTHLVLVQIGEEIDAGHRAIIGQGDRKPEPGRITARGGLRQMDERQARLQPLVQEGKVLAPGADEIGQPVQLREGTGCLHVGDLQVVADMAVGVLVIVAVGQVTELPAKALAAGVVASARAVAVATPVAKALGNHLEFGVVGEYRPALAHGDVMGWVETQGADVAKGADMAPVPGAPQGIAAVFDEPQAVLATQRRHRVDIERIAQ